MYKFEKIIQVTKKTGQILKDNFLQRVRVFDKGSHDFTTEIEIEIETNLCSTAAVKKLDL
jgi:hypothetical protein